MIEPIQANSLSMNTEKTTGKIKKSGENYYEKNKFQENKIDSFKKHLEPVEGENKIITLFKTMLQTIFGIDEKSAQAQLGKQLNTNNLTEEKPVENKEKKQENKTTV